MLYTVVLCTRKKKNHRSANYDGLTGTISSRMTNHILSNVTPPILSANSESTAKTKAI